MSTVERFSDHWRAFSRGSDSGLAPAGFRCYLMAILAVAAAALIRAALDPLLHTSAPLLVFVLSALGAALYGGFRAGIAATGLALLTVNFFFMEPRFDLTRNSGSDWASLALFAAVGIAASSLVERLHRANRAAMRKPAEELERRVAERTAEVRGASLYARSLIEASLDPLVTISPAGKITDVNRSTERATGVGRERLIGTSFSEYFTEPWKAEEGYHRVLVEGFVRDYPLTIRHVSGGTTDVLYNATVYRGEDGNVRGVFAAARDVTERKRMEEQLRSTNESRQQLAAIVESSEDGITGKTLDGVITSWNHGAERLYGYLASEVIGKPIAILVPPNRPNEVPQILDRIRRGEQVEHYETVRIRKDGSRLTVSLTVSPIKDAAGRIVGASTIARNVTERKGMEEEVRAASLYARSLIEASLDPLVTISPEGKITDVNEATELVTGVPRDRLIGSSFSDYFTEPRKAEAGYQKVLGEGLVRDYPLTIRHVSGRTIDVLYNATVYRNQAGEVQGVFAAARDITVRKRMEEELRAASLYARILIEASLDPLVTISPEGKITDVNQATELATGAPRDRLIGSDFSDYFTEPGKARAGYRKVLSDGLVRDYPLTIRRADGQTTDVLYNAVLYRNEAGQVQGVFAAARDVTERKRLEEELRVASLYARSLIEASLDPLVTISPEGQITDVNEATELVTGTPRDRLIGSDFSDYFTEPDRARAGYRKVLSNGLVRDYPLTIRHTDGHTIDVLYNAVVYRNEAGQVEGVFAAARDVTDRKRAEAELARYRDHLEELVQQRTSELKTANDHLQRTTGELVRSNRELEQFAYVASHDLQEPLRAVTGYLGLLEQRLGQQLDDHSRHQIAGAVQGATRMHGLITDLLALSRVGTRGQTFKMADLNAVLDQALESLRASVDETGATVSRGPLPTLLVDANQMVQLLQNLVGNAIKFRGKRVPEIQVDAREQADRWVLAVRDNGIGIEPRYFERIFMIFQRLHTRRFYPGTGIGLAVCKKIVERHGGTIWVESQPGQGSTFYFTVPKRETP